jgi:DNA-directed RNA polymerase subunit RPC12/RpoP
MLKLCLLIGKNCPYLKYGKVRRENPLIVRTCRAEFRCSEQFIVAPQELEAVGECEKASTCLLATEACKLAYNKGAFLPHETDGYYVITEKLVTKMSEIVYECVRCGRRAPLSEWLRVDEFGQFKCPSCGFKVARKLKPPVVKRVRAV